MRTAKRVSELKNSRQERRREFYQKVDQGGISIREAVIEFRYMLGKSQDEFAEFAGIPKRMLKEFEQGIGNPTLKSIAKMLNGSGLEIGVIRKSD